MNSRAAGPGSGNSAFVTTRWSIVLAAQGESSAAEEALEKLCRAYWLPIYVFIRRQTAACEEAEDLTQAFFARFLERRDFESVRREKGRLRCYILASLKNFLATERYRAAAAKRGSGQLHIPLHELVARERAEPEPADTLSADVLYDRRWALTLLDQVMGQLAEEYFTAGNERLFERLKRLLANDSMRPTQAEIACELGMTENAVKQAFHRMRQRYRTLLEQEIADTVANPAEVQDELRHLIEALRA